MTYHIILLIKKKREQQLSQCKIVILTLVTKKETDRSRKYMTFACTTFWLVVNMHISLRYCFKILADFTFAFLVLSEFSFHCFWLIEVFVKIIFVRRHNFTTGVWLIVWSGVSKSILDQTLKKTTISYKDLIAICDQNLCHKLFFSVFGPKMILNTVV